MKITCKFVFNYPDKDTARQVMDSLEVDNYRYINTQLNATEVKANIESDSILSLLHTTEDYLSCLTTAENVIEQTKQQIEKK